MDHLLGQESTVIKPLGTYLHGCSSLAGATIGGDGRVRLVLDPAGLLENLQVAAPAATRKVKRELIDRAANGPHSFRAT